MMSVIEMFRQLPWIPGVSSNRGQDKAGAIRLPPLKVFQSRSKKEPLRSLPISANTPAEVALLMVKVTPFRMTVKDPVAVAKRISAAKFEGSVGSDDPGRKCRTSPMGVQVMSNVADA